MINKVSEIDLKIKALQDKKKKLEEKQFLQLAQMIKKSGASVLSSEVLVGVMIEAVKTFEENQDVVKQWQQVGREFLTAEKEKNQRLFSKMIYSRFCKIRLSRLIKKLKG